MSPAASFDPHAAPTVHELQALAKKSARRRRRRPAKPSRAALLQLTDALSRWAGSGVALFGGAAIFLAVSAGVAYPFRAITYALSVLAALWLCRRLQAQFRSGDRDASRPFRWRANYTASLSVLSAAFGAGALILLPPDAPREFALRTIAIVLVGAFAAGALHAAHGRAAAAASLPAVAFALLASSAWLGPLQAFASIGPAAAVGGAGLFFFSSYLKRRAMQRFPRTGLTRRGNRRPRSAASMQRTAAR
jgi:hypothetical protein